jgi:hypothetical protein
MGSERSQEPDGRPHSVVICAACRARVDMSEPLKLEGWQVVHRCSGQVIEAETLSAGTPPWAWRAHSGTAEA